MKMRSEMNETLETFLKVVFSADSVGDMEGVRGSLSLYRADILETLRAGFGDLVEQRTLTLREFSILSDLDFESEDELYSYLRDANDYLFKGAETPPEPPS
jgi:hypothetical protein